MRRDALLIPVKKTRTTVHLKDETLDAVKRHAQQRRWTVGQYIREATELAVAADERDGDAA